MIKRDRCWGCGGPVAMRAPEPWCAPCVRTLRRDQAQGVAKNYRHGAFGHQIRRWREESGLSRQEAAERADIQYPRLSRIELGDVRVGPAVAGRLGPVLGFTQEELLAARDSVEVVLADDALEARDALDMQQYYDEEEAEFLGTLQWLLSEVPDGGFPSAFGRFIARPFMLHYLSEPTLRDELMPIYREHLHVDGEPFPVLRSDVHRLVAALSEDEASKVIAFIQGLLASRTTSASTQHHPR